MKEKKVVKKWRQLEAKGKVKRKEVKEVRHKAAEQEWLRIAQKAYLMKMEEKVQKHKEAKEAAQKQLSGGHFAGNVH